MIAIVQRVSRASVSVNGRIVGQIGAGMLVLAAVEAADTDADVQWTAAKLVGLRIFPNADKAFDLDLVQIKGQMLLVSNFTVAAETSKGRRPSLSNAAPPEKGRAYFDKLVAAVRALGVPVETGEFGADMQVELANDGPATFVLQSCSEQK
jgi:D-tyrosyl-tRNA(Tyr) deacylase